VKRRLSRPARESTSGRISGAPLLAAVLVCVGLVTFANGLDGAFVFDDHGTVLENPHIRALWPLATLSALSEALGAPPQSAMGGRPVVALSFAINYALGGLDPWGYHLWNLGVHILAALALFGIVRRTCRSPRVPEGIRADADPLAFVVSLIWLVHPLQTEVIGYLTQRTESTMGLFYFLTLYAAMRAMSEPAAASGWTAASLLACALGTASKEAMVTAPVAVLLYDVVFGAGSPSKAVRERAWLYGGLALTWMLLAGLVADGPRWRSAGFSSGVSPWTYLLHQPGMIITYLTLALWPSPLVLDYGRTTPIALQAAAPALLVVLALVAATGVGIWKQPLVGYLGAWFWITLAPSSSILPIATEVGAERRMYLPLAAVTMLLVLSARWAIGRLVPDVRTVRTLQVAAVLAVCVAFVWLTVRRNAEYRSEIGIWQSVLERRPHPRAHYNVAGLLAESGRGDEALEHYRAAADDEPRAHYALGFELEKRGRLSEAVAAYQEYLERQPNDVQAPVAHIRLGITLRQVGKLPDAARSLEAALAMTPADPDALGAYAEVLVQLDRFADALRVFERLVAVTPGDADAHESLGLALLAERRPGEAVAPFERAVALAPLDARKRAVLGSTLIAVDRIPEGLAALERAFALGYADPAMRAAYEALRTR
jgi:protein O-mannosyl-transferase